METTLGLRVDADLKKRFAAAILVGRPSTMTGVIEHLMEAYCETTERAGRQPEFPLEVRGRADEKGDR